MVDASRLPPAAEIRHSSRRAAIMLAIFAAMVVLGVWLAAGDWIVEGVFLLITAGPMSLVMVRRLLNRTPRLVISDEGSQVGATRWIPWTDIRDVHVSSGGKSSRYLNVDHPDGREQVNVDHFERDHDEIEALVAAYQQRHKQSRAFRERRPR